MVLAFKDFGLKWFGTLAEPVRSDHISGCPNA